jgi:hypothetical protein
LGVDCRPAALRGGDIGVEVHETGDTRADELGVSFLANGGKDVAIGGYFALDAVGMLGCNGVAAQVVVDGEPISRSGRGKGIEGRGTEEIAEVGRSVFGAG